MGGNGEGLYDGIEKNRFDQNGNGEVIVSVYKKPPIEIILDTANLSKKEIQEAAYELMGIIGDIPVFGDTSVDEIAGKISIDKIGNRVLQLAYSVKEERLITSRRIQSHVSADIYPIYKRKGRWIRIIVERRELQIIEKKADDYIDFIGRYIPKRAKPYATERLVKCIKETIEEVRL